MKHLMIRLNYKKLSEKINTNKLLNRKLLILPKSGWFFLKYK